MKRAAICGILLALVAGCGGTPNTPDGSVVNSPGGSATPPPGLAMAELLIDIPTGKSAGARAHYVSTRTRSVVVALASVDGQGGTHADATTVNTAPGSPGCKSLTAHILCTGTVDAVAGNDVFNVTTFAGPNGTGPVLSAGHVAASVSGNGGNVLVNGLSLTIDGVVASLRLSVSPAKTSVGVPSTAAVTVTAYDAAGAAIVGGSDYSSPITLSIQGDATSAFDLHAGNASGATVSLVEPGGDVKLTYDGNQHATSVALQATASAAGSGGSATASATYTLRGTTPPAIAGKIYVLNRGADGRGATVTVYDAKANGNAAPQTTLQLSATLYAQTIALDSKQDLYVGYFDSPLGENPSTDKPDAGNEIAIFAPGASATSPPTSTIGSDKATGTTIYPAQIAFDPSGDAVTYGATNIDGNAGNAAVLTYPAGASAPAHGWNFTSPHLGYPGPTGLALDAGGNFYVPGSLKTGLGPQNGVFVALAADAGNPAANVSRVLPWDSGTGLPAGAVSNVGLDASGEIYVADFAGSSTGCQAQVAAFASGSTGGTTDSPPLRLATIAGVATTQATCKNPGDPTAAHFPTIAVFGAYVYLVNDYGDSVVAYPTYASGTTTPKQTIVGSATALNVPIAIAIAPSAPPTFSARKTHARYSSQDAPR